MSNDDGLPDDLLAQLRTELIFRSQKFREQLEADELPTTFDSMKATASRTVTRSPSSKG